jgi:hypothetical protein
MKKLAIMAALTFSLSCGAFSQHVMTRYGGPGYDGKPALNVTAALIAAGGGAKNFSAVTAMNAMAGPKLAAAEISKLTKQYGKARVDRWVKVFDFAVKDAVRIATEAKVKLPQPTLKGAALAATLIDAGLDKNTFYVELLLDKALSRAIHMQVMDNIDAKFGEAADADFHRITNQAMYDLAHALGKKQVKLAKFH